MGVLIFLLRRLKIPCDKMAKNLQSSFISLCSRQPVVYQGENNPAEHHMLLLTQLSDFRGFCTNPPSDENTQLASEPSVIVDRLEVNDNGGLLLVCYILVSGHAYSDNWDKQARKKEFG